jgi:hypothetical protein
MIKLAVRLAKERGVSHMELVDMAREPISPGSPNKFRLADMSLLTTGWSWYHQFAPLVSKDDDALAYRRAIIETNTWDDVYACLQTRTRVDMPPSVDIRDIDTSAPGSAKEVLTRIKYARTDFFFKYEAYLLECSGVHSIYGWSWTVDMDAVV